MYGSNNGRGSLTLLSCLAFESVFSPQKYPGIRNDVSTFQHVVSEVEGVVGSARQSILDRTFVSVTLLSSTFGG